MVCIRLGRLPMFSVFLRKQHARQYVIPGERGCHRKAFAFFDCKALGKNSLVSLCHHRVNGKSEGNVCRRMGCQRRLLA